MILNFTVSNWMSFRDETQFSMIATEQSDHSERLTRINSFNIDVLPISLIFGGNASGKSNLVEALIFAKQFVLYGNTPDEEIAVVPYLLNPKFEGKDTNFEFRLLIEKQIYEFDFSVNQNQVMREKLTKINLKEDELLYSRENGAIEFGDAIRKDQSIDHTGLLKYVEQTARANQLFLTHTIFQNIELFRPVFNWFKSLVLIGPSSKFVKFHDFFDEQNSYAKIMNKVIQKVDVGISSIQIEDIPIDSTPIPDQLISDIKKKVGKGFAAVEESSGQKFLITRENGSFNAKKLVALHKSSTGDFVKFELTQESDGTKRIIELFPAFFSLVASNCVIVIDEIDRSLHSILIQGFLEAFLDKCGPNNRSQVILTSHNVDVMDRSLVRSDEIWVTEKKLDGATNLHSLVEYRDSRSDENFRKSYLEGRFGGVPHIQIDELLEFNDD